MEVFVKVNTNDPNGFDLVHMMPFDEVNGLHKTREQLEAEGVLTEYPEVLEAAPDQMQILKYNTEGGLHFVLETRPLTPEEENQQLKARMEAQELALFELAEMMASGGAPV